MHKNRRKFLEQLGVVGAGLVGIPYLTTDVIPRVFLLTKVIQFQAIWLWILECKFTQSERAK